MKESVIKQNKMSFWDKLRKYWQLYVFLLLPIVWIILFKYVPMAGLQIAFKNYTPRNGIWGSAWVGAKHFIKFFSSYQFTRVVGNTLKLSLYTLFAGFPLPVILALLLNSMRAKKYKSFVENVTYMPHFISTVVMVGIMVQLFNVRIGLVPQLYQRITGEPMIDLFGSAEAFPHLYVWSGIWSSTGWNTVIYMAALASVDPEQHEAALIDGASRFQRLLFVDLPAIIPTITITLILRFGNIMGIGFDKVYLMQNELNLRASEVISTYVYKTGLAAGGGNFSYATAIGMFNSVINLILISIVNAISRKVGETSLW